MSPEVTGFFDEATNTVSYVVKDPGSAFCAVIDPLMDIDYAAGRISYQSADRIIAFIESRGLELQWLVETHVHADHLSSALYLRDRLGGRIAIGEQVREVQARVAGIFGEGAEFRSDGSQFDHLLKDGERYLIGGMPAEACHTPGHTPACYTHVIGDAAFVGDTLFMPDGGTARCDFPGGCARQLYRSIKRILALPAETRLFTCHDYAPNGRAFSWETSVAEQRSANIHVKDGVTEEEFVALREARDRTLAMPRLIIPSLQVNVRAGELPERFLKVPLNAL